MDRNNAIACYVMIELETPGLIEVYRNVFNNTGDFAGCVWYPMHCLDTALDGCTPTEILAHVADMFSVDDDYFHISRKGILISADEDEIYRHYERYEDELIDYLQAEKWGHTGDTLLDSIIESPDNAEFNSNYERIR